MLVLYDTYLPALGTDRQGWKFSKNVISCKNVISTGTWPSQLQTKTRKKTGHFRAHFRVFRKILPTCVFCGLGSKYPIQAWNPRTLLSCTNSLARLFLRVATLRTLTCNYSLWTNPLACIFGGPMHTRTLTLMHWFDWCPCMHARTCTVYKYTHKVCTHTKYVRMKYSAKYLRTR